MLDSKLFKSFDIRIGTIIGVEKITGGTYITHKVNIDFGPEIGTKVSVARLINYSENELINKQILGVVNLNPKNVKNLQSEVLILGAEDAKGECVLAIPNTKVENGSRVF